MVTALVIIFLCNLLFVGWRVWVSHYHPRETDVEAAQAAHTTADVIYLDKVEQKRL